MRAVTLIRTLHQRTAVLSTQEVFNKCKTASSSSPPLAFHLPPPQSCAPLCWYEARAIGWPPGCDRFQAWVGMAPREDLGRGPLCSLGLLCVSLVCSVTLQC